MQINTTHKRPLLIFTLAAAVALSVPSSVRAQVDSWDTTSSGKWETAADWSLGVAPSISQLAVYITNADSILNLDKAVTIDATTAGSYPATMNTDYLIVSAPSPVGQSFLIITNATFTPLQLINLSIGVGGVVNMFDSLLVVKPGPGSLTDDGSMTVGGAGGLTVTNAGAVIVGNAANGELACPGGSSTLASNVVVGNLAGSTGVLTVSGGQVTVGPSQVSGDVDLIVGNSTAATGTVSVSGGTLTISSTSGNADLILGDSAGANGSVLVSGGSLTVTSADVQASIAVGLEGVGQFTLSSGTLSVGGVGSIDATTFIGLNAGSTGAVWITGGQAYLGELVIGLDGSGQMVVSNGYVTLGPPAIQDTIGSQGTLTVAGGVVSNQGINVGGALWVTGGQIIDSEYNEVNVYGLLSVSNGMLQPLFMNLLTGRLNLSGGSINFEGSGNPSFSVQAAAWITGGQLIITNGEMAEMNIQDGGAMTISNGLVLANNMSVGASGSPGGILTLNGGTNIVSTLAIGGSGEAANLWLAGGRLVATNTAVVIGNATVGQMTLSNGTFLVNDVIVGENSGGQGSLIVPSGNWTVPSSLVVGNCASNASGTVTVDGGGLYVTNSTHTAVLDVSSGEINLSGGTLQVDTLVLTNSCSQFSHTGGTLIAGNLILSSNTFRIVSLTRKTNDMLITWMMEPGATNALQVSSGGANGNYQASGFSDIFIVTNNTTVGAVTNYLDVGAATNVPARYYRARLQP